MNIILYKSKIIQKIVGIILFASLLFCSCQKSPSEDIISLIDKAEQEIGEAQTWYEMDYIRKVFIENLTKCLDENHNGYRFDKDSNLFLEIDTRLDSFNKIFWLAGSKVNNNLKTNDEGKIAKFIALLKVMEVLALTTPEGFDINKQNSLNRKNEGKYDEEEPVDSDSSNGENYIEDNSIKRNFDGIILGVSNKDEVISYLKKINLPYTIESDGNQITVRQNNIYLGGIAWNYLSYVFINGVVVTIVYIKNTKEQYEGEYLAEFEIIKRNLFNKYRQYYIPGDDYSLNFSDEKTSINFIKSNNSFAMKYSYVFSNENIENDF